MWFLKEEKLQEIIKKCVSEELRKPDSSNALSEQIHKLKDELADLQTTKKQEQRDIEHLIKIKEEKLSIEHQKSELTLKGQYTDKEMALQKDYFDKVMNQVEKAKADMQQIYTQILERLPNVNASLEIKRR